MGERASEAIQANWKVSEVIGRYPELIEVLAGAAPAFRRLRNPIARRVQSRLVTVEQAARIAGIEPEALVRRLNQAAGLEPGDAVDRQPGMAPARVEAPPDWFGRAPVAVELDVRPLQEGEGDVFQAIMGAVRRVPEGQTLKLVNSFEPVPLYDLLAQRGFEHHAVQRGPEEWEVHFFLTGRKGQSSPEKRPAPAERGAALEWDAPHATIAIDVSELVPPEPMMRILEKLEEIGPGERLLVHHQRRPMYLYPQLDALGYRHETRDGGPGQVHILIERPRDSERESA